MRISTVILFAALLAGCATKTTEELKNNPDWASTLRTTAGYSEVIRLVQNLNGKYSSISLGCLVDPVNETGQCFGTTINGNILLITARSISETSTEVVFSGKGLACEAGAVMRDVRRALPAEPREAPSNPFAS